MPKVSGLELLKNVKQLSPDTVVVIVTAFGSTESAVEAMKLGAVDYLCKPCTIEKISRSMRNILERNQLPRHSKLEAGRSGKYGIVGRSRAMQSVYERIDAMCHAENTVLIMGESGQDVPFASNPLDTLNKGLEKP